MEDNEELPDDAITDEEIDAAALPVHSGSTPLAASKSRNAFTELMSPQEPKAKLASGTAPRRLIPTRPPNALFTGRNGLGAYIASPSSYKGVIYQNEHFVAIYDGFPKSSVHVLLLPRDISKTLLHPFDAFDDHQFLESVKIETKRLKSLVASELRRLYGKQSAADQARNKAMETEPPLDTLPPGRDWEREVLSGIHCGPSMNHLHIHVLSVDRLSVFLKHRKHYNSFATPFLVDIEDFPLDKDDERRNPAGHGYLKRDLVCWRCGKNYGSKFVELKEHLATEFEEWKHE